MSQFLLNLQPPASLGEAAGCLGCWRGNGIEAASNAEALVLLARGSSIGKWTSPPSAQAGDTCYFACAKSAPAKAARLLKEARNRKWVGMEIALEKTLSFSKEMAGCVFAHAVVAGPAERIGPPGSRSFFAEMTGLGRVGPRSLASLGIEVNRFGGITMLPDML